MRLHQTLLACTMACMVAWPAQTALAHEFWIEPVTHHGQPGDTVQVLLKVGQTFRGAAQPYLPNDFERFELMNERGIQSIEGLLGDSRPAARVTLAPGLNTLIHHTVPFDLVFAAGDVRWPDYVVLDGLQPQLDAHPEIPQATPVSERYVRTAKSLIVTDTPEGDRLSGRMPYELVVSGRWATGANTFTLYAGDRPKPGVLIKAFRHSDREVVDQAVTNDQGQVLLTLPTLDRYLISGVVINPDPNPDFDWLSHWPSLTIAVAD